MDPRIFAHIKRLIAAGWEKPSIEFAMEIEHALEKPKPSMSMLAWDQQTGDPRVMKHFFKSSLEDADAFSLEFEAAIETFARGAVR